MVGMEFEFCYGIKKFDLYIHIFGSLEIGLDGFEINIQKFIKVEHNPPLLKFILEHVTGQMSIIHHLFLRVLCIFNWDALV